MKKIFFPLIILIGFLYFPPLSLAAPTLSSSSDQSFNLYQGVTSLRPFTVTDVIGGEITKDFGIKISLPEGLSSIFDTKLSKEQFSVSGTAVTNGRVATNVQLQFEDKGRAIKIAILNDFIKGEQVILNGLYLKDIYVETKTGAMEYPMLAYSVTGTVRGSDRLIGYKINTDDRNRPDIPTSFTAEIDKSGGIILKWNDPWDLDLSRINIYRGKNLPASATVFQVVQPGIQQFIDTDVIIGDVLEYSIEANDGRNASDLVGPLNITVTAYVPPPPTPVVCPENEIGIDTNNDTIPDTCQKKPVTCLETEDAVDTGSDGVPDTCKKRPIVCAEGETAKDTDADGINDTCEKIVPQGKVCGEGETPIDTNNDGATDDCQKKIKEPMELPKATFADAVLVNFADYINPFKDTILTKLTGEAAAELFRRGVIKGQGDSGKFRGDLPVNRAEAAKMLLLARYETIDEVSYDGRFSDVLEGEWYTEFIAAAAEKGIINGYPNGTFRPEGTINAAEFLKMMALTFELELDLDYDYSDIPADAWFAKYVGIATRYELFPDRINTLDPGHDLTRDEFATAIFQYLKNR
ncbi:S-layer homology domain-containing protein [Candidatus Peregrinibacteria bacterium]|nr:S-layer homology domain-containing protein [Candidatus Peregrinibacteria bacterium]